MVNHDDALTAEQRARRLIDAQLSAAGWEVQDRSRLNLYAAQGVAVRESIMAPGHGRVDYLLYVDRAVIGVIEAKPVGATLTGVEWQSAMYASGLPPEVRLAARTVDGRLPFVIEASGTETHLTNGYDPEPRARAIFAVPQPATFSGIVRQAEEHPDAPTWRGRVARLPALETHRLRPAQIEAITGVERSLVEQRFGRSLVQMATGAGKTFTAVTLCQRLLRYGGFRRILFLVDRNNLGDQALAEFQNYRLPDDGRRFTEVWNADKLTSAGQLGSSSVVISTIQRVYAALRGEPVPAGDAPDLDAAVPGAPVTVDYDAAMPPESFDLIIVDEAHRSIYGVWREVVEYFDAHVVRLTATPGKQTLAFFEQNLVSKYTYPQSVADGVNVDFSVFRIRTQITAEGSTVEAGEVVPLVDRRTRARRYAALEEDLTYTPSQLDRAVESTSQIRLVLETFRDRTLPESFPGRTTVPKTLIFCKDDHHAEAVVTAVRQVFGRGNDFAAKITYSVKDPKAALKAFRTSPTLRVAVTVDMIATGTDVKPLECLLFMRDVRSGRYFEQMKGRGARTIEPSDFRAVTPDAASKTGFLIVDAVGVTDHALVDPPLNRVKGASLEQLLGRAAAATLSEDEAATLASRLAKLELDLTPDERAELDVVAGQPVRQVVRDLVDAVDPDAQALATAGADPESQEAREAVAALIDAAVRPLATNPDLRERIVELRRSHDRVIDELSVDVLLDAHGVVDDSRVRSVVESWRSYLEEHRAEITAIQLLDGAPGARVDYGDVEELARRIKRPPYGWTPQVLWQAHEALDAGHVRRNTRSTVTDLVQLVRFALGVDDELVPYADRVEQRYAGWLAQQEQAGVTFTDDERWWLDRMAEVIASSARITPEDLDGAPFTERGGVDGALRVLGSRTGPLLTELDEELAG